MEIGFRLSVFNWYIIKKLASYKLILTSELSIVKQHQLKKNIFDDKFYFLIKKKGRSSFVTYQLQPTISNKKLSNLIKLTTKYFTNKVYLNSNSL